MKISQRPIFFGAFSLLFCIASVEFKLASARPRTTHGKDSAEVFLRETRIPQGGKGNKGTRAPYLRLRTVPPSEILAKETSSQILECEAGGSPTPTIHWLKNGKRISQNEIPESVEDDEDIKKGLLSLSFTRSRLYLDCIHPRDAGMYTCVASSPVNRITADTHLKVVPNLQSSIDANNENTEGDNSVSLCLAKKSYGYPARIHMWTYNRLELIGSDVQLFCRSSGVPKPTTRWLGPDETPLINNNKYHILSNGDLVIRDLDWDDMGNYICVTENQHGSDRTSIFLYPTLPE